jgi:hypothetical protein
MQNWNHMPVRIEQLRNSMRWQQRIRLDQACLLPHVQPHYYAHIHVAATLTIPEGW